MEQEIWKDVIGYEGKYQVSNLGNVKSLNYRQIKSKEKLMKLSKDKIGYKAIGLCKFGKYKIFKVHRLVAQSFIPNPYNKPQVNHKDGNKLNNCIDNLEWCTSKENMIHCWKNGLNHITKNHHFYTNHPMKGKFGKEHNRSKEVNQYTTEGKLIKTRGSMREIKREIGVSNSNISLCCKGKLKTAGGFIWKFNF